MEFTLPDPEQLGAGLRALHTVATSDGQRSPEELAVLQAARSLADGAHDLDALTPIEPDELASAIVAPGLRHQLVGAMLVTAMADGEVEAAEADCIGRFAAALGIEDSAVDNLQRLASGQHLRVRLDILRRHWAPRKLQQLARERGKRVYLEAVLGMLRLRSDPELTQRYRALVELPEGTLGRAYFEYMTSNEFTFPGEVGAPPEVMVFHDMSHILSGYGTTPPEEILVAAFSAGYSKQEVLNWFMFVLCQFQLGLQTPPNVPPERLQMDPRRMLAAYRRGAAMAFDINDQWDYWEVIGEPVEELRVRYGIRPERDFLPAEAG